MIKVQMREDDDVDILVAESHLCEALEQNMLVLLDTEPVLELGLEEGPNPGLEQDVPVGLPDQQRSTCEVDSVPLVCGCPALPERTRRIAEHGPAIELLGIAKDAAEVSVHRPV
jgi:hypothetical protein